MNDPKFQEASKLFAQLKPVPSATSYELEQQRIRENHQRLKAARLAREASNNNT
jgi:hypothetical protein